MLNLKNVWIAEINHITTTKDSVIVDWYILYDKVDAGNIIKITYPHNKRALSAIFTAVDLDFEWCHNEVTLDDLIAKEAILLNTDTDIIAVSITKARTLNYKTFNLEVST